NQTLWRAQSRAEGDPHQRCPRARGRDLGNSLRARDQHLHLEEAVMHAEMCPCPKCRREREMACESESFECGGAGETELGSPLSEAEEVELAMELMAVSNEAEMEQ